MKLNKTIYSCMLAIGFAGLTSCVSDSSTEGGFQLPVLEIAGNDADELTEVNFNYGDECVIKPEIRYCGSGQLTYEWSVATFDDGVKGLLEPAGDSEVFTYRFPQGGSYIVHLKVSDGTQGCVKEYRVNVNRSFEIGYLIVANDADGKGNLTFIKNRTPEEIEEGIPAIITERSLEKVNDNLTGEKLVGSQILLLSWPKTVTRVVVATEDKCHFLDPNTFVIAATVDYSKVVPGFKAGQLLGDAAVARAYDPVSRRYITVHGDQMFGYEESDYVGHGHDVVFSGSYVSWGNRNFDNYYVNRSPLSVSSNTWYTGWSSTLDFTEESIVGKDLPAGVLPLFGNDELVTIFMGEPIPGEYSNVYPCYVISRDKGTGYYYTTHIEGFGGYDMGVELMSRKNIEVNSESAVPATECNVVASETYHRYYYYNGNCVYAMLFENETFAFPSKSQSCISFPEDEEVTFIGADEDADRLIVATFNSTSGRGSVYFYNTADVRTNNPNPEPDQAFKNVTGRVSQISFKPRVAN